MFKIFNLEGLFLSKLKRIVSVILAVTMLMTVAPVSTFASAEYASSYQYGSDPTYTYTPYYYDTMETDEVVRVADQSNKFAAGEYIVAATPSGIPDSGNNIGKAALAGEVTELPDVVITFYGRKPDTIETPTSSSLTGKSTTAEATNRQETFDETNKVYRYSWKVTEGKQAVAGDTILWTIEYGFTGDKNTYEAYAYMHVENTLRQSGYVWFMERANLTGRANTYASHVVTLQGKNMYSSSAFLGSKNKDRGYLNFHNETDGGSTSMLGVGNESTFNSTDAAFGRQDNTNGTMVKLQDETRGSYSGHGDIWVGADGNRALSYLYLDAGQGETIDTANVRQIIINGDGGGSDNLNLGIGFSEDVNNIGTWEETGGYAGRSNWDNPTNPSTFKFKGHYKYSYNETRTSATESTVSVPSKTNTTVAVDCGEWWVSKFTGSPSVGTHYYTMATSHWGNSPNKSNGVWGRAGMSLTVVVYNTANLRAVYNGILRGTGSYGSTTFNKGANPREEMFNGDWATFEAAMHAAGRIIQTPDTSQTEIDNATNALLNAYANITPKFSATVNVKVNFRVEDTTVDIAPPVNVQTRINADGSTTTDSAVPAGAKVTAYALKSVAGYTLVNATETSKVETIDGTTNPAEITFYYKPATYEIIINTNNPNVAPQIIYSDIAYGAVISPTVAYPDMGTKEHFVLDGLYYDAEFKEKLPDPFTMPAKPLTLYAKWVTAPLGLLVQPQTTDENGNVVPLTKDGAAVAPIRVDEISPDEDESVAVYMDKPETDPYVEGYIFTGYYADANLTTALTWPQEFYLGESDRTVYGRFVDVNGKIIFESNGGSNIDDIPFTAGTPVNAPAEEPTREGYDFAGWYTDNTFATAINWPVTQPDNTGFVAYAKWTPQEHYIRFNLNNPNPSPYDTKEIQPRKGLSDSEFKSEDIPNPPRRFGYVFDRWMYNDGTGAVNYTFKKYPTKDIEVVALWRKVEDSAFIGIEGYEKLSGEYKTLYDANTNPDGAKIQAGDIVTFRMTSLADFYVGSTLFVFMYDKDFFEFVPGTTTMFKLNGENEYVSGINATFTEVTNSSLLEARWPADLAEEMNDYAAMQIAIDPTVAADDYFVAPMKDGEWLVEFQLRVKDDATGSGKVYMDNAWTRSGANPMGTMFYGWAENSTDPVYDTVNNTVYPDLENATETIVLDATPPVDTTVKLYAAPGAFSDNTNEKTYTGRAETEIIGYTDPEREGYELVGWKNKDTASEYTEWDAGYYAKAGYGDVVEFEADWQPLPFAADFYMGIDEAHYKQVEILFDAAVTPPTTPPTKTGYVFAGWSTDGKNVLTDLGTMDTTEGKKYYAVWDPAEDTAFTVEAYVLAEQEDVYQTFSYTGTTDSTVKIVREADVPATPEAGVTYITVESLEADLEYYVLDEDDANNALPITGTIDPEGKLVLKVYFEGKPVTVTFDADGGKFSNGESQYLSVGPYFTEIVLPTETPTKYGYDFVEWIDEYGDPYDESFVYFEDETYTASWTPVSTNIQFIADGVQIGELVETEFGKAPKAPTAPSKTGWEFRGWKETADGTDYVTTLPAVDVINDEETGIAKTYYAHYEQVEINVIYKVTYADGRVETKYTDKYFAGTEVTIRAAETLKGHTFSGWKRADGSDAVNFTMGTEEVIISGTFTANSIGIVFNANGGTFGSTEETTVNTTFNTTINLPAEPTKAGYTFKGWATSATATSGSTSLGTLTEESGKYYAVWEANTVTYYIDVYVMDTTGAYPETPETTTSTGKVDSEVSYTPTARTGFEIAEESVLEGTIPATEELHLVVKYKRNQWNLITTMDGETVDTIPYYFEQTVADPPEPQKSGYGFGGWTPSVPETMPNNDVTLTATMNPNTYNVIYDYKGGTYQGAATTSLPKTYGTVIPSTDIATDNIVYEGHTFAYWVIAGTDTPVEFTETTPVVPVDGITFEAVYTVNKYTVTYSNRGTTVAQFEVPYGTTIEEIKASYAPGEELNPYYTGHTFKDWAWDSIGATMPARDVTVLADWDVNTYKIEFNENGGSPVTDIEVPFNSSTNFSGVTTKSGYNFEYWYLDDENTKFNVPTEMPALDELYGSSTITLNAKWSVKAYSITFESKGGSDVAKIEANYGDSIPALATPERKGYTFDYWYLTNENTKFEIGTTMPALDDLYGSANITLNAKWTVKTITITFDSKGGSAVAPITLNYGDYIANRPADPTMEGYTFTGWNTKEDGTGDAYTVPESMEHDKDITVYATWEKNQYTIIFNSNQGSAVDPITAYYGDPITVPANPTREGHEFKHWYYKNPGEAYDFGTTMAALDVKHGISTKSITVNALWEIQKYTITFDTDGGSAVAPITEDYGTAITKPSDPTKPGYTFLKWDTEIPGTMPANNMTIKAIWEANEYTIAFEENGGTDVENITKAYDTDVTAPANPTKKGHNFVHWYEQGSEDTAYVFDKMPLGGVTLYAKWDAIEYTININANGGTNKDGSAIESIAQDYGTAVIAPADPVKEGHTFNGWYVVGTETKYTFPETMPDENVNIEAKWTINPYDVIFYNYDGTEYNKTSPDFGTAIAAPEGEPVREHYTFVGWSLTNDTTDDETETPIDFATANLTVTVGGNKFYPIFKRVPVTLELIANSSARVTTDGAEPPITGYIYGIAAKTNVAKLTEKYLAVKGDGELIVTPTKYNLCGTGTRVDVWDNVDEKIVETYYIVIFGDLNGDSYTDTIDRSMLINEVFGNTIWSQPKNLNDEDNDDYAYHLVLAADLNGDGNVRDNDLSLITDVTLYAATIKQEVELTTESKMVYPS